MLYEVITAYNEMASRYKEDDIIVLGYSLGAAAAAKLAADNNPQRLILQAPFYSIVITSYSIHYTKLYEKYTDRCHWPVPWHPSGQHSCRRAGLYSQVWSLFAR